MTKKNICSSYHAERNFLGKIGVCWGTKECEACSCGGDESKCDFYKYKRDRARPLITNADHIRSMTDEVLCKWLNDVERNALSVDSEWGLESWFEWLTKETEEEENKYPCASCKFYPPSSSDGKPCSICDPSTPFMNCYEKMR